MADDEKKIFIDEDWKSQVEREKEQARSSTENVLVPEGEDAPEDEELFETLISGMSAQTLLALGLLAQEGQQQVMVDLGMAQHLIETLAMLEEKTAGNVTEREGTLLKEALGELRQAFAARAHQVQQAEMRKAGIDPTKPPTA